MWNPDSGSLPSWIEDAYTVLESHFDDPREEITRERAHELLLDEDDFEDEPADAEYAVKRLLERGWLYEVKGELRITDRER